MLLESIRNALFGGPAAPAPAPVDGPAVDPMQVAACALLLEVAHADGEFSDEERSHLELALGERFGLTPETGHLLLEVAEKERSDSIDHFRFTARLRERYSHGEKVDLAEVMWGLVLADGSVGDHEHYLARKIANLLDLDPASLSAARAAAEAAKRS